MSGTPVSGTPASSAFAIERVVTSGTFSLDGQDFDVDNNVWLVGDENEVLIVDAAHDADAIPVLLAKERHRT